MAFKKGLATTKDEFFRLLRVLGGPHEPQTLVSVAVRDKVLDVWLSELDQEGKIIVHSYEPPLVEAKK